MKHPNLASALTARISILGKLVEAYSAEHDARLRKRAELLDGFAFDPTKRIPCTCEICEQVRALRAA